MTLTYQFPSSEKNLELTPVDDRLSGSNEFLVFKVLYRGRACDEKARLDMDLFIRKSHHLLPYRCSWSPFTAYAGVARVFVPVPK